MNAEDLLRTALHYHLTEVYVGDADQVRVAFFDGGFQTADDGRGMGIERTIAGRPYVDLMFGQLELLDAPLDPAWMQLHGLGMSLLARHSSRLELEVHRKGERRRGAWNRAAVRWDWLDGGSTREHGTTLRVWPRAPFDPTGLAAVLERWRVHHGALITVED